MCARSEDAATALQMRLLVESPTLRAACPMPFDEARMLQGEDGERHKARTNAARCVLLACCLHAHARLAC